MPEHISEPSGKPVRDQKILMIQRCGRCRKLFAPLTAVCSSCLPGDLESVPSSGIGSIVSWRLIHRSLSCAHAPVVPLTIAIVELDEGPWVCTTIEGDVPPFSSRPVRVRFEPRSRVDRFPVFAVCPVAPGSDDGVGPAPQCGNASNNARSTRRSDAEHCYDASWVRTSLRQCDLLAGAKSLDSADRSLVGFAIRWAPFGGADAGELLVTFGVTRRRFLQMMGEALRPRRTDSVKVRGLKHRLTDSLMWAWRINT
ncbi:Zn-ribbon domain-containing OB-fold protein [Nocardia abscessus]|uniref:Zn-ribbon domain-containing OB-fold protein n=2 Tax=Nocardia abscessus TaxID=120957 RepID=UPI00313DED9F